VTERSVFAPGKILLFGEHSAVFGYPAVGTSIDRGMTITAAPAETMSMAIMSDSDSGVAAIPEEQNSSPPCEISTLKMAKDSLFVTASRTIRHFRYYN
jgi:mevalonate kinase